MSFEHFAKYHFAKRVALNPTIDEPIVIIAGLTIADLGIALCTFLFFAIFIGSPFVGLLASVAAAALSKHFRKNFPRGAVIQRIWSLGFLRRAGVPTLLDRSRKTVFGP